MNKVYIISPHYIRNASEIGNDVEDKYISRSILSSQNIDIQGILGTQLFEVVIDACHANAVSGTSLTTRMDNLIEDYLVPTLMYSVLRDVLPYIYFKITPKSVSTQDGQYSKPVEYDLLTLLKKDYDEKYQHHIRRMINYIDNHADVYPEYGVTRTDGDPQNMEPGSGNYFSGLEL